MLTAALLLTPGCAEAYTREDMRAFPQPYRSMLAICSDIDGTTPREFEDYHKFLNSLDNTEMGPGLGLDVADSFWMYMANDIETSTDRDHNGNEAVMTYFVGTGGTQKNADLIRYYARCGWIDSMHAFGDFSRADIDKSVFTRALAQSAAEALSGDGLWPTVWINHGNAANTQNLRSDQADISYQQGGQPDSDSYHTDITIPNGIKFVWFSDNDGAFGRQDLLYPATLGDGQKVWGFRRYTGESSMGFHKNNWSVYGIADQLTEAHMDACVRDQKPVIVAQHLGGADTYQPFGEKAKQALIALAERQRRGEILVARTSRLLEYLRVRDHLVFTVDEARSSIDILAVDDPQLGNDKKPTLDMLRGMTFFVDHADGASISLQGVPLPAEELVFTSDPDGRDTIGIRWFEPDTTDYIWGAAEYAH